MDNILVWKMALFVSLEEIHFSEISEQVSYKNKKEPKQTYTCPQTYTHPHAHNAKHFWQQCSICCNQNLWAKYCLLPASAPKLRSCSGQQETWFTQQACISNTHQKKKLCFLNSHHLMPAAIVSFLIFPSSISHPSCNKLSAFFSPPGINTKIMAKIQWSQFNFKK